MFQHPPSLHIGGKSTSGAMLPSSVNTDLLKSKNRCLLVINNSQTLHRTDGGSTSSLNSLPSDQQLHRPGVSFNAVSFSSHFPKFVSVDQKGTVVIFDLQHNKYTNIARTGIAGTCVSFGGMRQSEIYLGLADTSIAVYNSLSKNQVAKLAGHGSGNPVFQISPHPSRPIILSASKSSIVLWSIDRWKRERVLGGVKQLTVVQASFDPSGDFIMAAFSDCSVMLWGVDTFEPIWKVSPGNLASVPSSNIVMAFSHEGVLLAGWMTGSLYIWDVVAKTLLHSIILECDTVDRVLFMGKTTNLIAHTADETLVLVDASKGNVVTVVSCTNLGQIGDISPDGKILATIGTPSTQINLFNLDKVLHPQPSSKSASVESLVDELALPHVPKRVSKPLLSASEAKRISSLVPSQALNYDK
eukprot:Partr_v1_DN28872_c2_g2_i2_m33483 putative WD repeat-containing protein